MWNILFDRLTIDGLRVGRELFYPLNIPFPRNDDGDRTLLSLQGRYSRHTLLTLAEPRHFPAFLSLAELVIVL